MKRVVIFGLFFLIVSCKTNPVTKIDNKTEVGLKGNWELTSVSHPNSSYIKINSFGIADSQCFEASTWRFISNNNQGEMTLKKSGCPMFSSDITWYINQEGNLVFKFIGEDVKAKTVKEGYVLKVANLTENSFQLLDKFEVAGKITTLVYQFNRLN
jgi:hypothetical protein